MAKNRRRELPGSTGRRQLLKAVGMSFGATLAPSPQLGQEQGNRPAASSMRSARASRVSRFFTPLEYRLVEELAETIIPADTHSGGAKAAKVADYIDRVVGESLGTEQKATWREGLRLINALSARQCGKSFLKASLEERVAVLLPLSENSEMSSLLEVRFFRELKRQTVEGYYTSRVGILEDLGYKGNTVLDDFVGCDSLDK